MGARLDIGSTTSAAVTAQLQTSQSDRPATQQTAELQTSRQDTTQSAPDPNQRVGSRIDTQA